MDTDDEGVLVVELRTVIEVSIERIECMDVISYRVN
jgi:hypothetical protein